LNLQVEPNRAEPLKLKRADGTDGTDESAHNSGQNYNAGQISLIIPARNMP